MKRSAMPTRTKPLSRSRMTRKAPSPTKRQAQYGPKAFRDWLHRQECQLCGVIGFTQQAHTGKKGMGQKTDWKLTTALCGPWPKGDGTWYEGCHARADQQKLDTSQKQRVLLSVAVIQSRWQAHRGGTA